MRGRTLIAPRGGRFKYGRWDLRPLTRSPMRGHFFSRVLTNDGKVQDAEDVLLDPSTGEVWISMGHAGNFIGSARRTDFNRARPGAGVENMRDEPRRSAVRNKQPL